jgi:hypothetical protein
MESRHRRVAVLAVGLIVTAVAVVYFVHGMRGQWAAMGQAFARANYAYLVPSVGFIALVYALRVVRWRLFLKPAGPVPVSAITSATLIGFMSSCVLPLRPGEVIRPYVLHRKAGVTFGVAAGTAMGLERTFDLFGALSLLLLFFALTWWSPLDIRAAEAGGAAARSTQAPARGPQASGAGEQRAPLKVLRLIQRQGLLSYGVPAAGVLAMVGALVLAFAPSFMLGIAGFFLKVLPGSWNRTLMGFLGSIAASMAFLRSPGRVAAAAVLSCALWLCYPLSTYSLSRGFELELPFAGALLVQIVLTAAVAAPQAPGFFGVFQSATAAAVLLFGVSKGDAGAFANMLWAVNVVPITVVGLAVLHREGLSLRRLARMSREAALGEAKRPDAASEGPARGASSGL